MSSAAETRPIPLRARRDLQVAPLRYGGRRYWGLKDPLSLAFYQLREEEYFIWRRLDGQTSLEAIQGEFEREFVPHELDVSELQAFLARLHRDNLVVADGGGQGGQLLTRYRKRRLRTGLMTLGSVLAIRFRGINPGRFLDWLAVRTRWIFSGTMLVLCLALVLSAVALAIFRFDTLLARLPDWSAFLTTQNAFWLVVAVVGSKILHELGHALTCRHYGGQCHELGVMLLLFTPCLYCNVSDAWMLSSKWQRIAISAAGIVVELVLGAACTLVWWFSEPGLLNSLALNMMIVCTVSTLLFNGNPLLRYDGYYVLADLVEVPNLQEQASTVLRRAFTHGILGMAEHDGRLLPARGRRWLLLYGAASLAYRVVLAASLLLVFRQLLKPYRLAVLVDALAVLIVFSLMAQPCWLAWKLLSHPARRRQVNWTRALIRLTVFGLLLAAAVLIPLPATTTAPVVLQPQGAERVYVTSPGTLLESVKPGEQVTEDTVLARLENHEMAMELAKLQGERDRQRLHVANLKAQQVQDPAAATQLPTAEEMLVDLDTRLAQLAREQSRLTLRAAAAGVVLPPPEQKPRLKPGELSTWSGTPLDAVNQGTMLKTGTLLCLVGDPARFEAVLVIDQRDVGLVKPDQRVQILLDESADILWGTVVEIAQRDVEIVPREIISRGDLAHEADEAGNAQPLATSYQVRVALDPHDRPLLSGAAGRAKIHVSSQSLATRVLRYLAATFRLEW